MKLNKGLKTLSILLLLAGSTLTMASCGGTPAASTPQGGGEQTTQQATTEQTTNSKIAAVEATEATRAMKVGESVLMTKLFTVTASSGTLSTAEKKCTYEVTEGESVVEIVSNRNLKASSVGTAKVKITSTVDITKFCEITVNVSDSYFDATLSTYTSTDDFSKEDQGTVRTSSSVSGEYFVKSVFATKWYMETTFTYHSTASTENFPKVGIVANTADQTNPENNKVVVYVDIYNCHSVSAWSAVGYCEVAAGANWAWNDGVFNSTARHCDRVANLPTPLTVGGTATLGLVRDGLNFHVYVGGTYRASITTLNSLFAPDGTAVKSYVGLFQFNSDVTFSNYYATQDASEVNAKIPSSPTWITSWSVNGNGES